jgi:hypothetical protein
MTSVARRNLIDRPGRFLGAAFFLFAIGTSPRFILTEELPRPFFATFLQSSLVTGRLLWVPYRTINRDAFSDFYEGFVASGQVSEISVQVHQA